MTLQTTYTGLRVLDLSTNIAGPFAAMILGDLGADVDQTTVRHGGVPWRSVVACLGVPVGTTENSPGL